MITTGILLAGLSGVFNGLFTTPMKLIPAWKWENIWLVFILTACLLVPLVMIGVTEVDVGRVLDGAPGAAVVCALAFGFAWGGGSILFGLSVDRLGVSLANTLVIGISSALGALVPMALRGGVRLGPQQGLLLAGVACFLCGVAICGAAGRRRDETDAGRDASATASLSGYLFAIGSGVMSAIFNIGYTLAQGIAASGERLGYTNFAATNVIWLLMLGTGAIPNAAFCIYLMRKNSSAGHLIGAGGSRGWPLSILMGVLWGGSIFLYGAAAPMLGPLGPAIGWPLSLAVALLLANGMGLFLGEWRQADSRAMALMRRGLMVLIAAILLCTASARLEL